MTFNPISGMNGIVLLLLILPNLLWARDLPQASVPVPWMLTFCEQLGRYGSMALTILPVGVWKFGFSTPELFVLYLMLCTLLLGLYWLFWLRYRRHQTRAVAMVLALLPCFLFFTIACTLGHFALLIPALLLFLSHPAITWLTTG